MGIKRGRAGKAGSAKSEDKKARLEAGMDFLQGDVIIFCFIGILEIFLLLHITIELERCDNNRVFIKAHHLIYLS